MISETLYKIGLIVFVTFINVMITFVCAFEVMFMCLRSGWEKTPTLIVTVASAALVLAYIRFNHKILARFQNGEKK